MNNLDRFTRPVAALALLAAVFAPGLASAGDPAAEINLLTGKGTAVNTDGAVRPLAKGSVVFPGEIVNSGPNSYVNLKFRDGAFILIRPNTRFQIESYEYQFTAAPKPAVTPAPEASKPSVQTPVLPQQGAPGRAFFRLLKGGFRAVSGLIGHLDHNDYRVVTPVATIGVRGTDYNAVICDAACAADPVIRGGITEGVVAEGGLVTGVIEGGIDVSSAGKNCDQPGSSGTCSLDKSQYLLVSNEGSQYRLQEPPRFLEVDPIPNPRTCAP